MAEAAADGFRCQGCGGPLTLSAGQMIIGPTIEMTLGDKPRTFDQRVVEQGWCGDCVAGWDELMGFERLS